MVRITTALVVIELFFGASVALAQDAQDILPPHFQFYRTDNGYIRLDRQTGHVSICSKREVGWMCEEIPDERSALENEIARLQNDNATLKKELLDHGLKIPDTVKSGSMESQNSLPNDNRIGRMMALIERKWRQFIDALADLNRGVLKKFD